MFLPCSCLPALAGNILWASVLSCLIIAWVATWLGSLGGVDAYRLLRDPQDLQQAAVTWLAWTAPYVCGTLLTYALAPPLMTKRWVGRAAGFVDMQLWGGMQAESQLMAGRWSCWLACLAVCPALAC
jgi:hypothetical protein